ncbi:MAG TPA: urease accessory protein UreD [Methylococcales bacterium]|nr:urease accessory protein UreD [Methylococcales bacterium]
MAVALEKVLEKPAGFGRWQGALSLVFENRGGKTYLTHRSHQGPLLVQRPFYPEGPVCHIYLIHPPGGVVGGDQLTIAIDCCVDTDVLVTTPAAGKFYRSNGQLADQHVLLKVAEGSVLEYLPQETIMFDGAVVKMNTRVELNENSRFFGWEMVSLGRPACHEGFSHGQATVAIEVFKHDQPLLIDRMVLNEQTIKASSGLANHALVATLVVYPATKAHLDKVRMMIDEHRFSGVTLRNEVLIVRLLAEQAEPVKTVFTAIWAALRPDFNQRQSCLPRIWST